jgi:heme/copper-type cytochrome/quinol oxidase subunit 2
MPLPALFGVATGIALSLMLVGRRLYDAMMADALSGRPQTGAFFMTVGLVLLAIFLVVLGGAVALFFAFRGSAPKPPI